MSRTLGAFHFHLALDDFGTGASNFELLRYCPFDEVKLDRTVIEKSVKDGSASVFVRATSYIAQRMGLSVVAEGIETAEELDFVKKIGIEIGQGYLFSPALPVTEVRNFATPIYVKQQVG